MQSQYDNSPDQSLIELRVAPFVELDFGQGWEFRVIVSDILLGLSLSSQAVMRESTQRPCLVGGKNDTTVYIFCTHLADERTEQLFLIIHTR